MTDRTSDYVGPTRRKHMTMSGADVLAECDRTRQYLVMALDNLDSIEAQSRQANPLQAAAILGKFAPGYGLSQYAKGTWELTKGAIDVLAQTEEREVTR